MRSLRVLVAAVFSLGLVAVGSSAGSASVARGSDPCDLLVDLRTGVEDLESARDFDADGYGKIGKAFKKAAKDAPAELRSAMKKIGRLYTSVGKSENANDAVDAYGKGLVKYDDALTRFRTYYDANCNGAGGSAASGSGGSGDGGTLVLGSETIALESSRCYLKEQVAAGEKILFTGQALGTNAAGEQVYLDVSRYDTSSQFAGDDVSVDIGDVRSAEAISWEARSAATFIEQDGSTLRAANVEVTNDDLETTTVSFEINC